MSHHILITGAKGQLGQSFAIQAKNFPTWKFYFSDRDDLDICDISTVEDFFTKYSIDFCINCAAYTAVDRAESEAIKAYSINEQGVKNLAKVCKQFECTLIHYSSDYVYHNEINRPLLETDLCTPKGIYAKSKLAGSIAALEINPKTMVIRTSWVYSEFGHNFVKTMLRLGEGKEELNIVYDQIGAPTYAPDIAYHTLRLINEFPSSDLQGIFNFANTGICSWYDFAHAIFDISNIDCKVHPIPSSDYPTPASRPNYSVLNTEKFRTQFEARISHWRDSLSQCLAQL